MIDQLAFTAKQDPIAFRLAHLDQSQLQDQRWATVLQTTAKAAGWKSKVSASNLGSGNVVTGRGIAIGGFSNARPAVIADITVNKKTGKITVTHLYCAMDLGTAVNPASVENQMSGSLIMGGSRALFEEVRFTKVRQTSVDWVTYPIMRFKDAPKVTTIVIQRTDQSSDGAGEPAEAAVAAAIGNAFFDATGVRLYRQPMSPAEVRNALEAAVQKA
jgi:nicotinate dehydrogenase subunit B